MISLRLAQASLAVSVLTCSYAFGQTFDYKQWDTVDVPTSPAQSLPDGSTAMMTQTSAFANTNPKKTFSLGIFKSGSMHRVTLESLGLGGGSACEELTFSLGYFVTDDWVQFHSHHIYGDNSTCHFYWSPTYESSGAIKYAEMELFATVDPQTVDVRMRAHYYGQAGNWVSTAAKTSIPTFQLPLRQVIAAQTNYSHMHQNWVYLTGEQVYANDSPILTNATAPAFLATYLNSGNYLKKATGTGATATSSSIIALGSGSNASGSDSVAIGFSANSKATDSLALGSYSYVDTGAYQSIAITGGRAYGGNAFATQWGEAYGDVSVAMGAAMSHGTSSVAIGGYDYDMSSEGLGNQATGVNSAAIGGRETVAEGFSSFATGNQTLAHSHSSMALGSLNKGGGSSSTAWVETDPILELGNGTNTRGTTPIPAHRSNAITTLKNGNTTLTNKAWLANTGHPLDDPASTTDSGGKALVVEGHTELKGKVIISEPQGDISMGIYE